MTDKIDAVKCDRCLSSKNSPAPMVQNATWLKLATKHETLCAKCAFARAKKRQVNLTFDDLQPCVFNLEGGWFDLLVKAEPAEKPVLAERAYAWQFAMITRSNQIANGLPVQDLTNVGKVLATNHDGMTLREAPEGGVYPPVQIDPAQGEKYFKVYRLEDLEAELFVRFEGSNSARLKEIIGPRGPGSLGSVRVRSIFRLLLQAYPNIETLSGIRVSGAHWNNSKELEFNLGRLAGISAARPSERAAV
jgi:hypothetical protein